ncbi:hypothetical protein SDC9_103524 [bioreactor metagenome]|uniref:Efflux RND transporter periplasmic adaptor subunit n=1 Tax=bioreactor metagenome TaxID=1076179 RepID=A0A645AUB9_9ZZZZ
MGKDKEKKEKKASMSEEPVVTFAPVETIDETPAVPVKKAKKKTNKKLLWGILGAALILVIVVVIVLSNNAKTAAANTYQTVTLEKGQLTAIVGATGTVRALQTASIAWETNGRIEAIDVKIGDKVTAGEELAKLAQSSLSPSIISAAADLVTAQRNLDDLRNSTVAKAKAQQAVADAQNAYSDALGSRLFSNRNRATNQDLVDQASAAVVLAKDKVNDAEDYYNKFSERKDDDPQKAAALNSLANARLNLDQATKNLNYYLDVPDSIEVALTDAEVAVAKANLEDALREWNRLKDGPDPADIAAAEARVASIQATLDMAKLTSPFNGTITEINSLAGDLVNAGTVSFRIDNINQLLVDVNVQEVDINSIKPGQTALLTFDAIPNKEYSGKVTEVARVGNTVNGVVNFKVTLQLLNPDDQVLPGMTAAVNITINQLDDILTVPNRAVRLVNGQQTIYVLRNGIPVAVNIQIGATSDTISELLSGDIQEGEQIILNPPSSFISLMSSGGMRP